MWIIWLIIGLVASFIFAPLLGDWIEDSRSGDGR